MADNVDKFGIQIDLDVSGLQAELIKSQNELRKFQTQLKSSTDTTEIAKLTSSITVLDEKIAHLGNRMGDMKKPSADATNALTNLSRVAQDAPYGFMGIANNLNPLLESFQQLSLKSNGATGALKAMVAGLSGPAGIGVALGVASSLIVAFGDEIDAFFTKLDEGSDESIRYKEALKGIGSGFTTALEKVSDVKIAFEEYHKGILTGEQALTIYNEQLGKNLGVKDDINVAEANFVAKSAAYVESQFQRALADAASKKAAEELLKAKLLQETGGEKTGSLVKGIALFAAPYLPKPLTDQLFGLYDKKKFESDLKDANNLYEAFNNIKKRSTENADKIDADAAITTSQNEIKRLADEEKRRNEALKNSNKTKQQIAEERLKEEIAILEAENKATLKWADEEMKIYNRMLEFYKKYGDIVKAETSVSSMREMLAKQDKEREKKDDTPFSERKISKDLPNYIKVEENRIKKFDKDLKDSQEQAQKYAEFMANTLTDALMSVFDAMEKGENPLQALGNYLEDLVKKFAAAVIQASIFQGILMLLPGGAGAAAAGGGFFGSLRKILGLAEGGIVSRPTLAMVGEGGQSEAVMPLNKLGNMMNSTFNAGAMSGTGAGNGQFVLKGNDLVLALQRSNYSLNLRRGNGI